ncbi:MAG TPA: D-alanyl-D-alanine carboxypeptidase family protein [Devosiaceae bacterium]
MLGIRQFFLGAVAALALLPVSVQAQDFDTKAKYAVLMDYDSGMLLFQKDADTRLEPASMAKLMTIAVVFNELRDGSIKLTDEFFISEHAWRDGGAKSGGSTMFAELNSKVPVEDLITSVIVQSGNDAAIALAEGIAGSEATFANIENRLAEQIGLTGSHFVNASGLPDPDQYMTARDLANLARYLISEFPEYYHIFSIPDFTWNKIKQENRNSLLEMGIAVDGLKTGHTEAAGYGSVVSTAQSGRRLIAVVHGLKSMKERGEEGRKLLQWGTQAFDRIEAFPKDKVVAYASVYGGEEPQVPLVGAKAIDLFIPKGSKDCPQATVTYQGPLRPPVSAGTKVAQLNVICGGVVVQTAPLYAGKDVGEGGIMRKATDALKQLALGWL